MRLVQPGLPDMNLLTLQREEQGGRKPNHFLAVAEISQPEQPASIKSVSLGCRRHPLQALGAQARANTQRRDPQPAPKASPQGVGIFAFTSGDGPLSMPFTSMLVTM